MSQRDMLAALWGCKVVKGLLVAPQKKCLTVCWVRAIVHYRKGAKAP